MEITGELELRPFFFRDTIMVANVLENSPAQRAGLKALDRIIAVDSMDFSNAKMDFPRFRAHFRDNGPIESTLKVKRMGKGMLDLSIVPDKVETSSIRFYHMIDDSTLYVRIDQFVARTYREFMEVLETNNSANRIPRLIIDVRDNPGGYLNEVTKILSQFFEQSELLLVNTKVRNGKEKKYETTGRNFYDVDEIVVLINENSASGSEVLAGALQDWDRGLVVGQQSFGKGLVQEQYDLNSGAAIRITVANYFLPSGRSIQHEFNMDSSFYDLNTDAFARDSVYYSLKERRPLYASEGIRPDLEIEANPFDQYLWPKFFSDVVLDSLTINFIEDHADLLEQHPEQLAEYELDVADFKTLSWGEQFVADVLTDYELEVLIRSKIAYFLFGEREAMKVLLEIDPYIIQTMELLVES